MQTAASSKYRLLHLSILGENIAHQFALRAAMYVFPLITLPYLTRVLGSEAFAVRAYVLSFMSFAAAFLDFGFNAYGTRAIALCRDDAIAVGEEIYAISALRVGLCAIGVLPVAALALAIPILSANPLYVALAYLGACMRALLPDFVFQGLEDMGIITRRYVVSQGVAVALILLLVRGPGDLLAVPAIEALAAMIALAWSWGNVLLTRKLRPKTPSRGKVRYVLGEASVLFVSSVSTTAFTGLTTIMIGLYISDQSEISYWSLAMTAVSVIQGLYSPISNSLYPRMCASRDFSVVKKFLLIGVPASLGAAMVLALFAEHVTWLMGGVEYIGGSYVMRLVSPVVFFSYAAIILGFPVLGAVGWTRQLTLSSVIAAAFHVVGLVALASLGAFSVVSVALLRCGTECVLCAARVVFVARCRQVGALQSPNGGAGADGA